MTQQQLRELVKASNPVSAPARLLPQDQDVRTLFEEVMHRAGNPQTSADSLEQPVERRRDMQTQETPIELAPAPRPPGKKRWLVPALAGAVAIIAIVVAVVLVSGSDEPEVTNEAPLTPLEVAEALNLAHVNGDWTAKRLLFADDATFSDLSTLLTGQANAVENVPFSGCLGCDPFGQTGLNFSFLPTHADFEWDGDGTLTVFDVIVEEAAIDYAAGVTRYHTCTQADATTVVCDVMLEGSPFLSEQTDFRDVNTYTVEDGLITHQLFDYTQSDSERMHSPRVVDYQEWVRVNRPELEDQLFEFFGTLRMTPGVVETHRELIAEWKSQG